MGLLVYTLMVYVGVYHCMVCKVIIVYTIGLCCVLEVSQCIHNNVMC